MHSVFRWFLLAGASVTAMAALADVRPEDEYTKRINVHRTVQPMGQSPFGENINLYTGEATFSQVDITLEGVGPPIAITRELLKPDPEGGGMTPAGFGDWTLSLPHIATLVSEYAGWQVGSSSPYARCTQFAGIYSPPIYAPRKGGIESSLWWRGYQLSIPGAGMQDVLFRSSTETHKPPTGTWPAGTIADFLVGCGPTTVNEPAGREGFVVLAPDGTRYTLAYIAYAPYETIMEEVDVDIVYQLPRQEARMLPTRVEDRFGNALTYTYDGNKLTRIQATDGREVAIDWNTSLPHIDAIRVMPGTAQQRTWTYTYDANGQLDQVILPDNSRWSFDINGAIQTPLAPIQLTGCFPNVTVMSPPTTTNGAAHIVHPSGLVGDFTFGWRMHAQSYGLSFCDTQPATQEVYESGNPYFLSMALLSKTLSGPGLNPQTWTYAYDAPHASVDRLCPNNSCISTTFVDITNPQQLVTRYTFSTRVDILEGQLLRTDFATTNGVGAKVETREYHTPDGLRPTVRPWGGTSSWANPWRAALKAPLRKKIVYEQDVAFVWEAEAFSGYWYKPTQVRRYSASSTIPLPPPPPPPPLISAPSITGYTEVDDGIRPPLVTYFVQWGSVQGATRYQLQRRRTDTTGTTLTTVYDGTNLAYGFTGRGMYEFRVRGCGDSSEASCGAWSDMLNL
jgi:YD repeat-containing protein